MLDPAHYRKFERDNALAIGRGKAAKPSRGRIRQGAATTRANWMLGSLVVLSIVAP